MLIDEQGPGYCFGLMKTLLDHANGGEVVEFANVRKNFTSRYRKLDVFQQGEYHHMWVEYLKSLDNIN